MAEEEREEIEGSERAAEEEQIAEDLPVIEIYGSAKNIAAHGQPGEHATVEHLRYYFYPTWRSQFLLLCGFFASCAVSVFASKYLPWSVIPGPLFTTSESVIKLYLPLFFLLPSSVLGKILINVYDAKYIVDDMGVEAQVGLVSLSLRQPRLRFEDIRGVEPVQSIWERILGIGSLLVGSAMSADVEITMTGVANPRGIQLLINRERERRMRLLQGRGDGLAAAVANITTD